MIPALDRIDTWFAQAQQDNPGIIPCCRGCNACCHGPFDISPAEAALVVEAVAALPEPQRAEIRAAARRQVGQMQQLLPQWQAPWDVESLDEGQFDAASEALAALPCPALAPDGSCAIHAARPSTCRLTGLPLVTVAGEVIPNFCPIQARFPAYQTLAPVPLDLDRIEDELEQADAVAVTSGWRRTTIAAAILRGQAGG